jgi:hypothetical protein
MRRVLSVAVVLAVLSVAANAQGSAETEVMSVVNRLFEGMRKNDSSIVRPLFHAKARLGTTTLRNGEAIVQVQDSVEGFIRSIGRPRNEVWDERISNVKAMIDGGLASVWTDYSFYRGTTLSHCGVNHFVIVKEGAAWKILQITDTRRMTGCS